MDQCEYATDVVFHRQADLAAIYGNLTRTAIHTVKPDNIATFLGRKLSPQFEGESGNRYNIRIEGTRIERTMGPVSLKLYDKFSLILRIETTVNDLTFFKHYREVEHRDTLSKALTSMASRASFTGAYLGTADKVAALVQDRTAPVPLSAASRGFGLPGALWLAAEQTGLVGVLETLGPALFELGVVTGANETKVDLDGGRESDRLPVLCRGLEAPFADGGFGFLVETASERAYETKLGQPAGFIDGHLEQPFLALPLLWRQAGIAAPLFRSEPAKSLQVRSRILPRRLRE